MAGSSAVLSDGSTLSRLDRGLEHLERAMAFVSGLGAFGLMFLAVVSVGGREFFNEPLRAPCSLAVGNFAKAPVRRSGASTASTRISPLSTKPLASERSPLNA